MITFIFNDCNRRNPRKDQIFRMGDSFTPTDFHLFSSLQHFICSRTFRNIEIEDHLSTFLWGQGESQISLNVKSKICPPISLHVKN